MTLLANDSAYLERWCSAIGVVATDSQGGSFAEHRAACLESAPFDCDPSTFLLAAENVDCEELTVGAFVDCLVENSRRVTPGYAGVTCATPIGEVLRLQQEIADAVDSGLPPECEEAARLGPGWSSPPTAAP